MLLQLSMESKIAAAKELCHKAVAEAHDKIIVERVLVSTKAKAKAAITWKRHAKELLLRSTKAKAKAAITRK